MEDVLEHAPPADRAVPVEDLEAERERRWIRASKRGDALAFNRLVLQWEGPIYNLALRMLQDPEEAAEATQEVFLSAFRHIGRFRIRARFSTWLYRIAANQCLSRLRRRPPGVDYTESDASWTSPVSSDSQEGELLRAERRSQVCKALAKLTEDQRAVVELKFFQDRTFDEIAAILELPVSTVKSRLYTSLAVLRRRLIGFSDLRETTP